MRIAAGLVFVGWAASAHAVPMSLTHQVRLLDSAGEPANGPILVAVSLHDAGGVALWSRTYPNTSFEAGYASLIVGGTDAEGVELDTALLDRPGVVLAVTAGGVTLEQPLTSVPYAMVAGHAQTASSLSGGIDGSTRATSAQDCESLHQSHPDLPNGPYWLDTDGDGDTADAFRTWCDMDGGGWTLVLQNNRHVPTPLYVTYNQSIHEVTTSGGLDSLHGFDILVGLSFWPEIGSQFKQEQGRAPMRVSKRATYASYTLNPSTWAIQFGSAPVLSGSASTVEVPGLYTYHRNVPWAALDGNETCIGTYPGPWWYTNCWSGNIWGDADGSAHQSASYWFSSGTDWDYWGAYWVK